MCGGESDEDGCGGEEKKRKTEAEVEGQCECHVVCRARGLEGEGAVWGAHAKPGCLCDTVSVRL